MSSIKSKQILRINPVPNSLGKNNLLGFDWKEKIFFIKQVNGTNTTKNSFTSQNEPHTDKLSFSCVFKHFHGN